jgi:hypothetical protein
MGEGQGGGEGGGEGGGAITALLPPHPHLPPPGGKEPVPTLVRPHKGGRDLYLPLSAREGGRDLTPACQTPLPEGAEIGSEAVADI